MDNTGVPEAFRGRLSAGWGALTPEARKAASYVLDNPREVGASTVREIAAAARVSPNTVVRMARQAGFEGYEDFRAPFREEIRRGDFADRARWLQDARAGGGMGALCADMVAATLGNVEETFAGIDEARLRASAEDVWAARDVYVLGVGVIGANARGFAYLASTGMVRFHAIPRAGSTPVDELAWADGRDVLIAMTSRPYRAEVVDAVALAREQGMAVLAVSDSRAPPILRGARHGFVVSAGTPQFFHSSVPTLALLQTLLSFVAAASPEIVEWVKAFHARRRALGLYHEEAP